LLARAIGWAAANWLLDAVSLWVFVAAFGHRVSPDALLVSYGLAYVLAAIPITPGGLGVVEAALTTALVGFGTSRGVAILGVVTYRLANFWLPIPAGVFAYLSLRLGRGATTPRSPPRERWSRTPVSPTPSTTRSASLVRSIRNPPLSSARTVMGVVHTPDCS